MSLYLFNSLSLSEFSFFNIISFTHCLLTNSGQLIFIASIINGSYFPLCFLIDYSWHINIVLIFF